MRAKIIHNPCLYTATEGVLEEVKKNINSYNKHIIITPERYTLITEKMLLKVLNKKCTFNCEVISINRLCNRVFGIGEVLDMQGGTLLIQKLLQGSKKELKFFKSMHTKLGFAENLYQTIMQFKSSGIKPEDVAEIQEKGLLKDKLCDIQLLYKKYENYIELGYTDGIYKMEQLRQQIKTNSFFNSTAFYFVFFESFTYQELKLVSDLIENNNFCVVGCRYAKGYSNDHIFTNSIYNQMQSIFFEKGIEDEEEYDFVLPTIFESIKKKLFSYSKNYEKLTTNNLRIFSAQDETQEVKHLLKNIYYLIHKLGYRYKDINVAVSNLEKYKPIIERELANFDFSFYFDYSTNLLQTQLGAFISSCLEAYYYDFMPNDLYSLLNNYYFGLTETEKDYVSILLTKYPYQGIKWLANTNIFNKDEELQSFSEVYEIKHDEFVQKVYKDLNYIVSALSKCNNAIDFVYSLKELFVYFNVEEKTTQLIDLRKDDIQEQKIISQIIPKINKIFEQIITLDIDTDYNALSFAKLIQTGLNATKINPIPLSVDSIYFGDVNVSTFERKKVLIILGANYGLMPSIKDDVGLIADREIEKLSSRYMLEPKVSDINMRSRLKAYELCILPTEMLYIYYPQSNDNGDTLKPSSIVTSLQKIFYLNDNVALCPQECELALINLEMQDKEQMLLWAGNTKSATLQVMSHLYQAKDIKVSSLYEALKNETKLKDLISLSKTTFQKPSINNLSDYCFNELDDKKKTSYTQISEYLSCPYMHFLKRAIKLSSIKPVSINQLDVGEILHYFAQLFIEQVKEKGTYFSNMELNDIKENVKNVVVSKYETKFSAELNDIISKALLKEGDRLMNLLNENLKYTLFSPYKCEQSFSDFEIDTANNKYMLVGKIDRIDKYDNTFLVLDYKTGDAKIDAKDIYYGNKLQLFVYENALKNKYKNNEVVGVGYFPIKDKYRNVEKEDKTDFKIDGYFIGKESVICNLDTNLLEVENAKDKKISQIYNFYKEIKSDGSINYGTKALIKEDFDTLSLYAKEVIKQVLCEIEQGYIEAKPKTEGQRSACDYCEYASICNKEFNTCSREYSSKNIEKIKEALSGISNEETTRNT